jgi:hypothetical protein
VAVPGRSRDLDPASKNSIRGFPDVGTKLECIKSISNFLTLAIFCTPNFGVLGHLFEVPTLKELAVRRMPRRLALHALHSVVDDRVNKILLQTPIGVKFIGEALRSRLNVMANVSLQRRSLAFTLSFCAEPSAAFQKYECDCLSPRFLFSSALRAAFSGACIRRTSCPFLTQFCYDLPIMNKLLATRYHSLFQSYAIGEVGPVASFKLRIVEWNAQNGGGLRWDAALFLIVNLDHLIIRPYLGMIMIGNEGNQLLPLPSELPAGEWFGRVQQATELVLAQLPKSDREISAHDVLQAIDGSWDELSKMMAWW